MSGKPVNCLLFLTACHVDEQAEWHLVREQSLRPLLDRLCSRDAEVTLRSFRDPGLTSATLASYTHVLVISVEKYNLHHSAFLNFLEGSLSEAVRINPDLRVLNSANLAAWNSDKTYLEELASAGFPNPKTEFVRPSVLSANEGMRAFKRMLGKVYSDRPLIMKPSVSASALNTHLLKAPHDLAQEDIDYLESLRSSVDCGSIMLQEFLGEIQSPEGGEWSIIYIGGQCTHVALKRPKEGEYRINSKFGGRTVVLDTDDSRVPASALETARRLWSWLEEKDQRLNDTMAAMVGCYTPG